MRKRKRRLLQARERGRERALFLGPLREQER